MVKALIFDFWGTIMENGTYSPLRQSYNILRPRMPFGRFVVIFEEEFMTRPFENQAEGFTAVCEALDISPDQKLIDELVGLWNKQRMLAKPFQDALEVLPKLKKNYKIVLVSNTDALIDQVIEKHNLKQYFDLTVFSYITGTLKTDPAFFNEVLRKLKISKEDALVIGDSLETDIKGAQLAGIKSVLLDRKNSREFEPKIQTLTDLPTLLENE